MEKIVLKYNSKRIVGLILISILMMLVFGYGLLFAERISSIEPSETSVRYRSISKLFYENEELVFGISFLLCFLFFIIFLNLFIKLLQKEFLIAKNDNKISFGNDQIGNIDNIHSIQITNHKYNSLDLYLFKRYI